MEVANWLYQGPLFYAGRMGRPETYDEQVLHSEVGMHRLTIRYSVSAEYLTIRYYQERVK